MAAGITQSRSYKCAGSSLLRASDLASKKPPQGGERELIRGCSGVKPVQVVCCGDPPHFTLPPQPTTTLAAHLSLSLSLATSAPTLDGEERRFVCRPLLMIVYMKFFLALLPLHPRFAPVRSDVSIASDKSRLLLSTSLISRINTEMSAIVTSSQQHYHHYY